MSYIKGVGDVISLEFWEYTEADRQRVIVRIAIGSGRMTGEVEVALEPRLCERCPR